MINPVFRTGKNCYPQEEEWKYVVKEKKMPEYITDNTFSDSDREDSDKETSNEENSDEEYSDEEN